MHSVLLPDGDNVRKVFTLEKCQNVTVEGSRYVRQYDVIDKLQKFKRKVGKTSNNKFVSTFICIILL